MHLYRLPLFSLLALSTSVAQTTPLSTTSFIESLGVNTHLDTNPYANLPIVAEDINYLGFHNLRDSAQNPMEYGTWPLISYATGAKFDDYIAETSVADMSTDLGLAPQLAHDGILNFLEGGNEEDDSYPAGLGNSVAAAAQFQQQVYATGKNLGLPVINLSFGAGWTADNNWHGDYDKVGDLSSFATYGNAHTYPNAPAGAPDGAIQQLNADSLLAAASRPVITTEIGWDGNQTGYDPAPVAKYALDAAFDGIKNGDVKTYFYALYDDGSGKFGLMNQDGSPKPAGFALHNLTTLLTDNTVTASTFTPKELPYSVSGLGNDDHTLMLQKSDGTYWLALWNETGSQHTVTLNLNQTVASISVFDPLNGTTPVRTGTNVASITGSVLDHPILIEIAPGSGDGASAGISSTTWYTVTNQHSGLCLDATGWGVADGTGVEQWTCGWEQSNQEWQFQPSDSGYYSIVNRNASKVVDVLGVQTADFSVTNLWQYVGGTNQQWLPVSIGNGFYKFVGRGSGRCLDTPQASTSTGARLQIYDCNGNAAQAFKLAAQP